MSVVWQTTIIKKYWVEPTHLSNDTQDIGSSQYLSWYSMDNLLTATEVAEVLGVSDQAVINWIREGRVPGAQKVGRTWAIPESSIEKIDRPKMGRPPKEDEQEKSTKVEN